VAVSAFASAMFVIGIARASRPFTKSTAKPKHPEPLRGIVQSTHVDEFIRMSEGEKNRIRV